MQLFEIKRIYHIFAALAFFWGLGTAVDAKTPAEYGPKAKRFGAGIFLGEPTGVTFKGYLTKPLALDAYASWSFADDAFVIISDVTYEFLDIPVDTDNFTLPFYAGAGAKIGFDRKGKNKGKTTGGIRVPLGVAMQFVKHPIEVFFEVAPGIELAPSTEADVTGGMGGRFYF